MSTIGSSLSKGEDGTPLVNRAALRQLAGVPKDMFRADFDAAVTQERANITNNGTGIWAAGEKISIFGELGTRIWYVGASAALSHARNVMYQGQVYALAADANVFAATNGAPASGTGANGDYMADATAGLVYGPKASGAWPAGVAALAVPGLTPAQVQALATAVVNTPMLVRDPAGNLATMTLAQAIPVIIANDGSVDPATAGVVGSLPGGGTVLGYQADGTLVKIPTSLIGSAGGGPSGVPVDSTLPVISGTAQVGQTLTADHGSWTNSPTGYTYVWKSAGTVISGATNQTYAPVSADIGNAITVTVTASNSAGSSTPATSAATSAVIAASGGGSTYPALTLSNSPAFDTTSPLQAPASLISGDGVMASGITLPNGTQGVCVDGYIKVNSTNAYGGRVFRLDDTDGHWMAMAFNQGAANGANTPNNMSPQSETYDALPYSGTAPIAGQKTHVAMQLCADGNVRTWVNGVQNTANGAATGLLVTDALKLSINCTSAGINAIGPVRVTAGRRYSDSGNFTPPTSITRDSPTAVIYLATADGTGS